MLRRGGITEIACISLIPPLLNTITPGGGGGGGFTLKNNKIKPHITATCFSEPHTNLLGARRSSRLGVRSATN